MNFLKYDGKFNKIMGSFTDYFILNLFFLVCCIPIVTIGPALNAMFTVLFHEVRNEHKPLIPSFKEAFKDNIKKSIALFLIYTLLGFILSFNLIFWFTLKSIPATIAFIVLCVLSFVYLASLLYVFALNARFENTILQTIKNSVLLSLANLGKTILMLVIVAVVASMAYFVTLFRFVVPMIGVVYVLFFHTYILETIFLTLPGYEPPEEDTEETP